MPWWRTRPDRCESEQPPPTIDVLFDTYCRLSREAERVKWAFANPRLLWIKTVKELAERTARGSGASTRLERLAELDATRLAAVRPEVYPIGPGPIEVLIEERLAPIAIIDRCRSPQMQARISPTYLRYLAYRGEDMTRAGSSWERGIWISRYAAEAARAWEPEGPVGHDLREVALSHLSAATHAIQNELDGTVFSQSIQLSVNFVARAEGHEDFDTLGRLFQNIGALFSDIWTVPGRPDDPTPVRVEDWLARRRRTPGLFAGLGESLEMPSARDCLHAAVHWYQRALAYRSGWSRGLTYKAILQTLYFQNVLFGEPINNALMHACASLAPELLRKHPEPDEHLRTVEAITGALGLSTKQSTDGLTTKDRRFVNSIRNAYDPGSDHDASTPRRRDEHNKAATDIERALRHRLPFAVYLRNFATANRIHTLGDPIVHKRPNETRIVIPQITYSLVDHKLLQLFDEGVVSISDPHLSVAHRLTLIPMLSLRADSWQPIVDGLVRRSARVVMLIDALTPGVLAELDMLRRISAEQQTLIVMGQAFRTEGLDVSGPIRSAFAHIVDWIDFAYDETYHSWRYKAHGIVQDDIRRFVRTDTKPVIKAWLGRADTPNG